MCGEAASTTRAHARSTTALRCAGRASRRSRDPEGASPFPCFSSSAGARSSARTRRSSPDSFHGVGLEEGLKTLERVRSETGLPVTSDFSDPSWGEATGKVVDFVQVPAYLCRQTSILRAAAETGKPIHLKKGQFMSPWNMKNSCRKLEAFGNNVQKNQSLPFVFLSS